MKKILMSLLTFLTLSAAAAEQQEAFFVDFDNPAIRKAVGRCAAASAHADDPFPGRIVGFVLHGGVKGSVRQAEPVPVQQI